MYQQTKNELSTSMLSKVIVLQTDIHADGCHQKCGHTASRVVKRGKSRGGILPLKGRSPRGRQYHTSRECWPTVSVWRGLTLRVPYRDHLKSK